MKKLTLTLIAVIAVMAVACKPDEPAKVKVKSVELSLATVEETQSLTATIEPADATDKTLTWSSSDESIATVDQSGKVTAVAVGTATITVKSTNGKAATCVVTVTAKPIPVESITLTPAVVLPVINVDSTITFVATIAPEDATNKAVTWISNNEAVATVDENGVVTGRSAGRVTITATAHNGVSKGKAIDVKQQATGITIYNNPTTMKVGGSTNSMHAELTPDNIDIDYIKVTWSSSNESVATVNQLRKLTAISPGTTIITATTHNGLTDSFELTVVSKLVSVTGVLIGNSNHIGVSMNGTTDVTAHIFPPNATNQNITWEVDDPTILHLSNMTGSSCTMLGLKEGYATLKVTTEEGNKVDECIVSVHNGAPSAYFKSNLEIPTSKISAGTFLMGRTDSDFNASADERPQHSVTFSKDFYMSKFEITNYQFAEFLNAKNVGINSDSIGELNGNKLIVDHEWGVQYNTTTSEWQAAAGKEHYPVIRVTWYGANEFATWVGGRLPTEAEWEYACRAGTTTFHPWGDDISANDIGNYAWYKRNSDNTTHPVGKKQPNAWGLYDMIGNVYEWCSDWYGNYSSSAQTDPTGPTSGSERVSRGSYFYNESYHCRSASRNNATPTTYSNYRGFRIVFDE